MKLKNNYFAKHPLVAVFLFTFICLLPEMLMRDFTPSNELRYLSIADEALRDGHFFAFFNHGLAYADKPPLYIAGNALQGAFRYAFQPRAQYVVRRSCIRNRLADGPLGYVQCQGY